ncbi:MAG: molecular chaperone HtpG [Verrucomicrobiota bacterium]
MPKVIFTSLPMSQKTEKHTFQAEIQQLLDIVIHSLYTDKEIFIRELISNAADACEKLRFRQSAGESIHEPETDLKISIATDDQANTITITDTGIGMTRDELIENLGTIAHSGSKAFLKQISEGKEKPDANLIGQFGVGFYSAFMVASEVKVNSRSFQPDAPGHAWLSEGSGSYEIEEAAESPRGTRIFIKLKEEDKDFAQSSRVESIIKQYSNFVPFPIELNGEVVNKMSAIWTRSKSDVKEEEYKEFYHYIGHDHEDPLTKLHFAVDAPLDIKSLLYVPAKNMESMGLARSESEVHLYCRKVLIQSKAEQLFPEWCRFLKGVVDSEDLPLNISRETMQDKALLDKLGKVITKRFLKFLDEEATQRPDGYVKFYANFGIFLKEGAALDHAHKDQLMKLLRFESSLTDKTKQTSLADYVSRMGSEQKEIYYLVGKDRTAIESGPYLEGFKARNLEVLFCYEPVDEYVMNNAREFDGKKLIAADHADVKLSDIPKPEGALSEEDTKKLTAWLKDSLGDRVAEVKASDRLVDSPALAINADAFMSAHMRRMMKAMNKDGADLPQKANLEINPRSAVIKRLFEIHTASPDKAKLVAEQILDNALISAGMLEDATPMVARMYKLLETV